MYRFMAIAGALFGAAGVALSAAAAHAGGGNVQTAATMLLAHAPVLLAVGLHVPARPALGWAAALLLGGVVLFTGDLLARHYYGGRLFTFAAPAGGIGMIAGWLAIAIAILLARPRKGQT